jgi:EmrB/QacA subfamily drug resistance transporter
MRAPWSTRCAAGRKLSVTVDARHKRLTLIAAIMGSFITGLDTTVVNVALPAIERDLGGGLAGQQWVVNAYLLALGSLILVGGSLGDLYGERRVFSLGVAGFGVMSVVCALAPSIELLIVARALQGVFGALLTPSALAIIVATFPPDERGAAIGSWTAWTGISFVVGPLVGGQLVDVASWRWIFAINVPFVAVTLLLVSMAIPARERAADRPAVDWTGALLSLLGLAGPVFALIRQPELGWSSPGVWVPLVAGLAVFTAFLVHEARTPHPMLPLGLFRRRNFAAANAETLLMYAGLSVLTFFLVLFLQQVAGYTALQAGLATLPTTAVMFVLSREAGRLSARLGPRPFMGFGPLVAALGLTLMLRLDAELSYWTDLLPALLIFATGLSMTVAPLTTTVLADADERNAGIASGVNNAIARVAGLLGVAALGAVVAAQFSHDLDRRLADRPLDARARAAVADAKARTFAAPDPAVAGRDVADAARASSVHAFHVGMGIAAALLAAGGVIGLVGVVNPPRRRPASHRVSEPGHAHAATGAPRGS